MPRIVHLGLGNFHRAHQAWYTHCANVATGSDWAITGVSISSRALRDALTPVGGAYTLAERGPEGLACRQIKVHDRILVAAEQPDEVIAAIAALDTQIVTLTITEKGYHLGRDGRLDTKAPAIQTDLSGAGPVTAIGMLARGLAQRAAERAPITVISCDNLSGNGAALARVVADFGMAAGLDLAPFLAESVRFPNTMVDRITPALSDVTHAEIEATTGKPEQRPVLTEAFSEWIIEDDFAGPRPDWARVGAILTDDVAPFEARKLRCLNAAHSALAYGGLLLGHSYVHQAFADPDLRQQIDRLWTEASATLPEPIQENLPPYFDALAARFAVADMRHRLDQIATDGSLKIALRLAPIMQSLGASGAPGAVSAIGAWVAYLARFGASDALASDPGAARILAEAKDNALEPLCTAAIQTVFPPPAPLGFEAAILAATRDWMTVSRVQPGHD